MRGSLVPLVAIVVVAIAVVTRVAAHRGDPTRARVAFAQRGAPLSASSALDGAGCPRCHLGTTERAPAIFASYDVFLARPVASDRCATCHVNDGLAVEAPHLPAWFPLGDATAERLRRGHAYRHAPDLGAPLAASAPGESTGPIALQRYTACGLRAFLRSPVPRRRGATESMFPLDDARIDAVVGAADLEACAPPRGDATRGGALFAARGCAACHGVRPEAPLLRLGIPLLARDYVAARVHEGSTGAVAPLYGRRWVARDGALASVADVTLPMPAYPDLDDGALDDLYRYLSDDVSDRIPRPKASTAPIPDDVWSPAVATAMYRAVQRDVFDTSCRHCHDPRPEVAAALTRTLGNASPVAFPIGRLPTPEPTPALRDVLRPGPGCTPSHLVERLRARVDEWSGEPLAARSDRAIRGMPLTLAPLPESAIRLVEAWTRHGCPSDRGDLCDTCTLQPTIDRR